MPARKPRLFTPQHIQFLKKNVKGITFENLVALFNKHFKTNFSYKQIKNFCVKNGIRNGMHGKHGFTDQMTKWLSKNVLGKTYKNITPLFNNVFDTNFFPSQIMYHCIYYGIKKERKERIKWTPEIKGYIKNNYKKALNRKALGAMAGVHFGTSFTDDQIGYLLRFNGIKLGAENICFQTLVL